MGAGVRATARGALSGARGAVSRVVWLAAAVGAAAAAEANAADAGEGERLYAKHCLVCHAVEPGYHREGPSLHAVYGRRAGAAPLFGRYRGLRALPVVWNTETLDGFLADPRAFLDGRDTSMTFKLPSAEERAAIIAYIRTLR